MNESRGSRQDAQMEELLALLESMQSEADQRETVIRQQDNEIKTLQEQLNESLNLCEKLNRENKAENVQALKNDLKQTRELLRSEKEKGKRADLTIEEYRDKLRQVEQEKGFALAHQKTVEIPVEKPVLYERCRNCDRRAYQKAKEQYEHQKNGLEKQYQAKTAGFHGMQIVVIGGVAGGTGVLLFMMGKRTVRLYQENCLDIVSAIVTVTSVAIVVYFEDWIKAVVDANLVVLLLLVQVVYVGMRTYVNGCKRARGYY